MLPADRWQMVERIFHEATSLPAEKRRSFVEKRCAGDREIQGEVLSLLAAESRDGITSESLAMQIAADWAGDLSRMLVGNAVDGYQVRAMLGAGGMGETYLAEDEALGRKVVLKFLPTAFGDDARRVRRFVEEARAASALNHPGILTVYGTGVFEGHRYIATEFIDGETLRERLGHGPLPAVMALDIAIQAAAALGAAHEAGIIHRDIKPENMMIRRDGYVKIIDFGLAKPTESGDGQPRPITRIGEVLGTADYMAPEQAAGGRVDARADLYSLMVVLYEMLTGELPRELGLRGSDGSGKSAGQLPPPTLRLVRRGVASDPAKRHQTAGELRRDLEQLRGSMARLQKLQAYFDGETAVEEFLPEAPESEPGPERVLRRTPSRPSPPAEPPPATGRRLAFTVAALLSALAVYLLVTSARRPAVRSFDASPLTAYPGLEETPALSPDGKLVAFTWTGPDFGPRQLYVKQLDASLPLQIAHGGEAREPAWSPDGLQIAFLRRDAGSVAVVVVPALGGPEREVVRFPGAGNDGTFWLAKGNRLVMSLCQDPTTPPCSLIAIALDRGTRKTLTEPPGRLQDILPAISPDGKTLAFAREGDASNTLDQLLLLPLDEHQEPAGLPRKLKAEVHAVRGLAWAPDGKSLLVSSLRNGAHRVGRVYVADGSMEPFLSSAAGPGRLSVAPAAHRMVFVSEQHDIDVFRVAGPGWHGAVAPPPERVVASSFDDAAPNISPDGKRIAFASQATGNLEIWVAEADGRNALPITSFGGPPVGTPRWSPDATRITFDSRKFGNANIFVVSSNGGEVMRLTDGKWTDNQPVFSSDGSFIFFASDQTGRFEIWKAPASGGKPVQVTANGGWNPRTIAGGQWLFYLQGKQVWRMPESGGAAEVVATGVDKGYWAPYAGGIARYSSRTLEVWPYGAGHWTMLRNMPGGVSPRFPIVPALSFPQGDEWAYVALTTLDRGDLMLISDMR